MINDLDDTLKTLLTRELPSLFGQVTNRVSISFDAPGAQFPPQAVTLPTVNLFLYDVRENRDLRSNEWISDRQDNGMVLRKRAPVRVDCAYLITSWASDGTVNPAQDEHRMLGLVMRALLRFPKLPANVLQGSLQGQEPDLPTTALQANNLQSLGEFWQALGGKPRAALSYTITISLDPYEAVDAPIVLDRVLRVGLSDAEEPPA
ncbi:MAG: DUF4255 domain-containing protein [Oscillochloris sp.]|nr:DUF4255 domain-containing protein [Oscillochloris sp.]